jgi:hypothetical protein
MTEHEHQCIQSQLLGIHRNITLDCKVLQIGAIFSGCIHLEWKPLNNRKRAIHKTQVCSVSNGVTTHPYFGDQAFDQLRELLFALADSASFYRF